MMAFRKLWISVSLYHDNIDKLIHDVAVPVKKDLYEKKLTSKFIFNRSWDRGENLILMCEIDDKSQIEPIKALIKEKAELFFTVNPAPQKEIKLPVNDWFLPFPNNFIHFNDNFLFDIMETGGLQASLAAENILTSSSDIILDFIDSLGEDWDINSAMGLAIQFHLSLLFAFDNNEGNNLIFFKSFFENILKVTQGTDDKFRQNLINGLKETFEEQSETLTGFSNFIISTINNNELFDDEWLNEWFVTCKDIKKELDALQLKGELITPENFNWNKELSIKKDTQEKWPLIEYYLRAVNSQLGIVNSYEINIVYSLKECLNHLSLSQNTASL